jgi:hypothetical protein
MRQKWTVEVRTSGMRGEVPRKIMDMVHACVKDSVSGEALAVALTDAGLGQVEMERVMIDVRSGERRSPKARRKTLRVEEGA